MAKKLTAQQLMLQRDAAEQEADEVDRIEYPVRFRKALSDALAENFEINSISPVTGMFSLYDRDNSRYLYVYDSHLNNEYLLDELEFEVSMKKAKRLAIAKKI